MAVDRESVPVDPDPGPLAPRLVTLVGAGGVLGSGFRYAVAQWLPTPTGFPWPTFLVNLLGALILGMLLEVLTRHGEDTGRRRDLRLLIGTGFCGGLTTYSTFAVEADLLIRAHRAGLAATYAVTTVVAGVAVVAAGITLAAALVRTSE